jgi:glutamate/aspartate transport system substrate-binding protein
MTSSRPARLAAAAVACAFLSLPGGTPAAADAAQAAATPAAPRDAAPRIDTLKRIHDTATITLGVRAASAPFSYVDTQREPQGYSIDLCMKVADAVKDVLKLPRLDVRFVVVTPANAIAMLEDGRIDLECGSTVNTRARGNDVAFAYTTFVSGIRLLVRKASKVTGLDDLRGRTVVVVQGTPAAELLRRMNAGSVLGLTLVEARSRAEAFAAIAGGRAAALALEDVALYGLIASARQPGDYAVVGKYLSIDPRAIMLRKGDPTFERVVDRTLARTFRSGEIRRIHARWFSTRELTVPMNEYLREAFAVPTTYPAFP